MIPCNKNIKKIKAYIPGKSGPPIQLKKIVKLSSNESPFSFNKKLINKIAKTKINFSRYPDPESSELKNKIAKKHKISAKNIIFGNGSDEIFYLISYCYLNKNLEGLFSKYGFLIYPIAIRAAGGKCVIANEKNYTANVDELIKKSSKNTRVCFIANPNNPTGTYLNKNEIKKLREGLPSKCLLVIDSAYSEYVTKSDYSDSIAYAKTRKDVIVTHTFSKIYGMSSLRLGWAFCPEEITVTLNKIRPAFNINSFAQLVGKYILDDKNYLIKSIKHNAYWKKWLSEQFIKLGFEVIDSVANFILIKCKNSNEAKFITDQLENNNIYVRTLESYKLKNCIRVSIGLEKDLKLLVNQTKKILKEKKHDFI